MIHLSFLGKPAHLVDEMAPYIYIYAQFEENGVIASNVKVEQIVGQKWKTPTVNQHRTQHTLSFLQQAISNPTVSAAPHCCQVSRRDVSAAQIARQLQVLPPAASRIEVRPVRICCVHW